MALVSAGWDPGMFSLARLYATCILPEGNDYTFWGRGVSQGHSDAIRRIDGVADARQYTVPVPSALEAVRAGENPQLMTRQKHTRECFVVAEDGADKAAIERAIVEMPNYFADYDTTVTFVSQEELDRDHAGIPHGGSVIRSGATGAQGENRHVVEFSLKLDSNPEFTGSVLVACARAVHRMSREGQTGCRTLFRRPARLPVRRLRRRPPRPPAVARRRVHIGRGGGPPQGAAWGRRPAGPGGAGVRRRVLARTTSRRASAGCASTPVRGCGLRPRPR